MIITRVEPLTKSKSKVYIDEQLAFVLYKGELSRYQVHEGEEISAELYQNIIAEVIQKRARRRALYLLKDMDRTEQQIRLKLRQGYYPEEVIEEAIEYIKSYHYVDDERYARNYIAAKSSIRSRRDIEQRLLQKGIAKELIADVYEEEENGNRTELELIQKLLQKKKYDPEQMDIKGKQKVYMFLLRRGFQSSDIKAAMAGIESGSDDYY